MKMIISIALLFLGIFSGNAQNTPPKGFVTGTLQLADGSTKSGFIKESFRKNASLVIQDAKTGKKENFTAAELAGASIDQNQFTCIEGDFFKIIAEGQIRFLQKASDASGKIMYNGTEAIINKGTPGKPDDYFIYNSSKAELKLVTAKTFDSIIEETFAVSNSLLAKAKNCKSDISQLKEAVVLLNAGK